MKVFVVLALAVVARATVVPYVPASVETGASAQFRSEDNLGNYNFGYNEDHTSGGTFRREVGDAHGNVAGSYGLRDADGRIRIVNYIANDDGFKADIKTNEPGVEPKDPADATINKAESVIVESAVAPYVAIPQEQPVAVAAPIFPPYSAVPVAKTVAAPITYTFPEPAAVPVAKSHTTVTTAEASPVAYAFPAPAAVPVAKSHTTTTVTESKPFPYAFAAPAVVPVAKSSTTITETKPISYAFPEPAVVPVAKSHTTYTETKPVAYAFPAPAAVPVSKSHTTTVTETKPVAYAFPAPAAVPVAKSHTTTTVTESKPVAYAFPAPAAVPVAKSQTTTITTEAKPVAYTFPEPAAIPVAKSIAASPIAVAEAAPLTYAFPAPAAVPVAKSAYAPVSYTALNYAPAAINYGPALRYTINPHLSGLHYASPYYKSLYSPWVASVAGSVPYFNNIEYHGYPVVKK